MKQGVQFSVLRYAAWAPGIDTPAAWMAWANDDIAIEGESEPPLLRIAPMLRRRAGPLAKMALEAAYNCLGDQRAVPIVFCSRHGEADRAAALLSELAKDQPLSPTAFGLSVHNAVGGLLSIARDDRCAHVAVAAGDSSVEHGVIEACGLLAAGEPTVLLVAYDKPLPQIYRCFQDRDEQSFAWAWLVAPAGPGKLTLAWTSAEPCSVSSTTTLPGALQVLRFYLRGESELERRCDRRRWIWSRDV